jgi:putative membrane protein
VAVPTLPLATDPAALTLQVIVIALAGLLYGLRVRTLARERRPVRALRQATFYGGLITIVAALSALPNLAPVSLTWQTAQNLIIGDVATVLIVLGLTGPVLEPVLGVRSLGRLRVLSNPLPAFALWTLDLYVWHLPTLYESALHNPGVHALEHLCFVVFGINMWMCLFGPLPGPRWFGNAGKLVYIVAVRVAGAVLANFLLWNETVLYSFYIRPDTARHVSPVVDQNVAGAIMLIECGVLTMLLFAWLYMRTMPAHAQRGELLESAREVRIGRSGARAPRALAGRGAGAALGARFQSRAGQPPAVAPEPAER